MRLSTTSDTYNSLVASEVRMTEMLSQYISDCKELVSIAFTEVYATYSAADDRW